MKGINESLFDQALNELKNGNDKEAYRMLSSINEKMKQIFNHSDDDEFITVFEKGDKDFEGVTE